ncbi:MAG TPA: adenylate/guanylate cyclase domain-containing protein, partial [Anaerolineales bacterium]|nr:adenylate/guanylate cyclase domain-containing protein [Anaerolineales bacterium]
AIRAIITVGDILHQEHDTIGTTMSLTARIEKITPPDEIYLSHAAWLVLNKAEVQTAYVGEFDLKGFPEPERIYKVDQKYKTRVLTNQYIVFTDAKRFTRFVKSASIEQVENFLLECDDLINEICEKHSGVIRQVIGDQYFLTFTDANQMLMAIEQLCHSWKAILERYKLGISIGIHKGNLHIIRSYVFGDDIHTTIYLSELDRFSHPRRDDIYVVTSAKVRDEFIGTDQEKKFLEFNMIKISQEVHKIIVGEHGAFEFVLEDVSQI